MACSIVACCSNHTSILTPYWRVNPGNETHGHAYVATGHDAAKYGVAPAEALEAWSRRARWPALRLDGVHLHVGSQILDPGPLERADERVCLEFVLTNALN